MRGTLVLALTLAAPAAGAAQTGQEVAERAILHADEALNQAVADRSIERFLALIAEDATFAGGGEPLRGREQIRAGWARYFEQDGPTLTWTPRDARVLVGGDVAITTGTWVLRARGPDGRLGETRGEYLTVWSKRGDAWQAVFDTGSTKP